MKTNHCYPKRIEKICPTCKNIFLTWPSYIREGRGIYCCRSCADAPKPVEERFWAKVKKTNGCWIWLGATNSQGYGSIARDPNKPRVATHRLSWEIHNGLIPKGMWVLHKCDNPPCVRPDHLFLGTQKDNMQDMSKKGRYSKRVMKGENHPLAKLTEKQVKKIRKSYVPGFIKQKDLGHKYGVSQGTIFQIVHRNLWKHI